MLISCFLALVVEILHSAIYGMNHYTVDKVLGKQLLHIRYPLDRDYFYPKLHSLFSELFRVRFPLLPNYIEHSWSCTLVDGRFQASP